MLGFGGGGGGVDRDICWPNIKLNRVLAMADWTSFRFLYVVCNRLWNWTKKLNFTFWVTNRSTVGRWVTKVRRVVVRRCVGVIAEVRAVVFTLSSLRCFFRSFRFLFLSFGGSSVAVVYSYVVGTSVVVGSSVGCGAFLQCYNFLIFYQLTIDFG